jgi:hypothetical protein
MPNVKATPRRITMSSSQLCHALDRRGDGNT